MALPWLDVESDRNLVHLVAGYGADALAPNPSTAPASGTLNANRAHYMPVRVRETFPAVRIFWLNGVTVNGNIDAGVYTESGERLVSTGSTAQSGTTAVQSATIALTLSAGWYFLAIATDSATATVYRLSVSANRLSTAVHTQASAFPLPATATFAVAASQELVLMGLSRRTVI